jgi:NADPH:quinone reductase-like Zn-dependent oxidoreductase
MAGLVALQALRDHGKRSGRAEVLINGASGGIGTFAVQIAKALGAEVTGVCSTRNVDMVRSIGADHVIDYTQEDFTHKDRRYDFILDNVANHSLSDLRGALAPTGRSCPTAEGSTTTGSHGGSRDRRARVEPVRGPQAAAVLVSPKLEDLVVLKELIEAGKVTPVIDRAYPLGETPRRSARGKGTRPRQGRHHRARAGSTSMSKSNREEKMNTHKTAARIFGVLFLVSFSLMGRQRTHSVHR